MAHGFKRDVKHLSMTVKRYLDGNVTGAMPTLIKIGSVLHMHLDQGATILDIAAAQGKFSLLLAEKDANNLIRPD